MRRGLVLRNTPPEWNIRVLTEDDFHWYCDRAGIEVQELPLEQPGLYICRRGHRQIYLKDDLRGADRLFVAFHELAHHWLHPPHIKLFRGWERSIEDEANVVAACALIPATVLAHYWPSEIVEIFGYTPDLVERRREVFDRYKI